MIFKRVIPAVLVLGLLVAAYFWLVLHWSYSSGERAGWIQNLSDKGWICKTWEGELALVSMPGAAQVEKFAFTAANDEVAAEIVKLMGRRVSLHYEERVGLPTSCFGDTRHFVTKVTVSNELSGLPGILAPPLPGSTPR